MRSAFERDTDAVHDLPRARNQQRDANDSEKVFLLAAQRNNNGIQFTNKISTQPDETDT